MNKNELQKYKAGYRDGWRAGVSRVEEVINLWVDEDLMEEYFERLDEHFKEKKDES